MNHQNKSADKETDSPTADTVKQLSDVITKKDQELEVGLLYAALKMQYIVFFVYLIIRNLNDHN